MFILYDKGKFSSEKNPFEVLNDKNSLFVLADTFNQHIFFEIHVV